MTLLLELFSFVLYLLQQVGIYLGVGAEMVLLTSYLLHLEAKTAGPAHFVISARFVERLGLGLIVLSGLGVVLYHVLRWDVAILLAPAFMAKWALIGLVLVGYKIEQQAETSRIAWLSAIHGAIGGTWLALFILHMLAPDTTLLRLLLGYGAWMAFFGIIWAGFVTAMSPWSMSTLFPTWPARPVAVTAPAPVATAPIRMPILPKIAMPTISLPTIPFPKMPTITLPNLPKLVLPASAPAPVVVQTAPKEQLPAVYHVELTAHVMPAPAPMHISPAPAPIKPVVVAAPAPRAPVKPTPAPSPNDNGLPKIWVMPRSPGQM